MHLVNKRSLGILVVVLLFCGLGIEAQNTAQGIGSSNAPSSAPAQPPQPQQHNAPSAQPPASSGQGTAAQPASPQAAPSQPQGQAPEGTDSGGGFVFHAQAQEVVLHATVVDEKQHLVMNLPKTAFTVFEDGKPQTITSFGHEDFPVALGIVIDNSGSMREKRAKVNAAALNLVRASNPGDQVFVVNFNDEFYLDQDFTSNIQQLKQALEKVESRGGTALYDAVVASADYLKKNSKLQKKVLFVVTDGEDNASRENLEQAVERLQEENGPTVYTIGLLGQEKSRPARRALQTISERTGGIAFLPKTLDEVDEISGEIAHDIRNQYTIGYRPTTPRSAGGFRTIHVEAQAKGHKSMVVRTRTGYYAGQEQSEGGQ